MKLKKIFAAVLSTVMTISAIATVASAASTLVNEPLMSIALPDKNVVYNESTNNYTATIEFHYGGRITAINGAAMKVVIPEDLKALITDVEWENLYAGKKITPSTLTTAKKRYQLQGILSGDSDTTTPMSNENKDIAKLKLTLSALPTTDQVVSLSTEAKSKKVNYQASVTDSNDITYYCFKGDLDANADLDECPATARKDNLFNVGSSVTIKAPAAPAEKHVEVAVKNAKGEALNLETPNYNYKPDMNNDVAVAFMATVTPNKDTVNGLTWTVKSGEKTRDDLVQSFGTITGETTISCGLIIKGISKVDSVDAVATVVSVAE